MYAFFIYLFKVLHRYRLKKQQKKLTHNSSFLEEKQDEENIFRNKKNLGNTVLTLIFIKQT